MDHIEYLKNRMQTGEEFEAYVSGKCYFLQPDYDRINKKPDKDHPAYPFTVVYDANDYENAEVIFVGTTDEVINYRFDDMYSMKNDIDKFEFFG